LFAVGAPTAQAQTTAIGDRYSGEVYDQPAYRRPAGQAAAASGPTLSWPGKTPQSAPQLAAPSPASSFSEPLRAPAYASAGQNDRPESPVAYPPPVPHQVAYQAPAYHAPVYQAPVYQAPAYPPSTYPDQVARAPTPQARADAAPPVTPWYQRYGASRGPSAPAPAAPQAGAPQSIYDPPAAATVASSAGNATPTAANDGETARFYSLHRQYGLTPDPDPIPPQFFTQTADLSDPPSPSPGPSPVYKASAPSGGSTTAVHAAQSDDPTSTLGQP